MIRTLFIRNQKPTEDTSSPPSSKPTLKQAMASKNDTCFEGIISQNRVKQSHFTIMFRACQMHYYDIVKLLLVSDYQDKINNGLHNAVNAGDTKVVTLFIDALVTNIMK